MMPGSNAYGSSDLQGSIRVSPNNLQQHQRSQLGQGLMIDVFPLTIGQSHTCEHPTNNGEKGKNSTMDEDDVSSNEVGVDGHNDLNKETMCAQWQHVRWTSSMIRLLITAVSYLTEEALIEGGTRGRQKYLNLHKRGKWNLISKVIAERGYCVSPQQCEDKFNGLDRKYKRLNDILGKGTSCEIVEKPALLDMMNLSERLKDEVRRILSSKHLFYEELCSYNNNNRLHLPHDLALQQSLHLALRSRDDDAADQRRHLHDGNEDDQDAESDDEDYGENCSKGGFALSGDPSKRMKQGLGLDNFSLTSQFPQDFMKGSFQLQSQAPCANLNAANTESQQATSTQKQCKNSQSFHLEEKKLQIEQETLELEKMRFKWQRVCKKKDRELEKLKADNERMKLENDRIALDLKRMEMIHALGVLLNQLSQERSIIHRDFQICRGIALGAI